MTDRLRELAAAREIVKAAVEAVEEVRPGSVLAAAVALLDERDAQQAEIAALKRKLEMCDQAYRTYRSLAESGIR